MVKSTSLAALVGGFSLALLSLVHCGDDGATTTTDGGGGDAGIPDSVAPDGGGDATPPDTTTCAKGTHEFPFRSGKCIDDPCDPDPCSGTGTCSNVTGAAVCTACTRFVDATGGADTNDGSSAQKAWKTLGAVNAANVGVGDNVCFKRGESFAGGLVMNHSGATGKPLRYGNYGDSAKPKPILDGFAKLGGWTPGAIAGVWKAACAACGAVVNSVVIDGTPFAVGRYPNANAPKGGYLTYESVIGPSNVDASGYYTTPYSGVLGFVDKELPSSPSWVGAEVVIRKQHWVVDRSTVTVHSGNTIQYFNPGKPAGSVGKPNWGYFFQNSLNTLDLVGEWYYDAAKHEVSVFFGANGPGNAVVEASAVETLVAVGNKSELFFDGLSLRGANGNGFDLDQAKNVALSSVEVRHSGRSGVRLSGTNGVTIGHSVIEKSGNTGILVIHTSIGTTIVNDVIQDSGAVPGTGPRLTDGDEGNLQGILISGSTADQKALVDTNVVHRTGYSGIHFVASGVEVKSNLVTNHQLLLDDGGGIYTWRGSEVYVNRKVTGNVVLDGQGSPDGTDQPANMAVCIYLDNATSNLEVTGNTMARCSRASILENYAHDVKVIGNTAFDSRQQAEIWSLPSAPITNNTCTDNVWVSRSESQVVMNVAAASGHIQNFGTFDRNAYVRPTPNDLVITTTLDNVDFNFRSLRSWQLAYGHDANGTTTPIVLLPYHTPKLVGGNLVTGGTFESGVTGVNFFSANGNGSIKANTGAKLTGSGSLEVDFTSAVRQSCRISSSAANGVGPISNQKTYLLKVSTLGTTDTGVISASLTQRGSPYSELTPTQRRSFGTKRVDHTFVFANPTSEAAGTFSIGIDERSGTTYVDDIEVYEVTATPVNPDDSIRFEVNTLTAPKTVALVGNWVDAKNVAHSGSITLAPLTSVVLFKTN